MSVPEPWTNQKTLEAGQALEACVYSNKLHLFKTIPERFVSHLDAKMRSVSTAP